MLEFSMKSDLLKQIHVEHATKKRKQEEYLSSSRLICEENNALGMFLLSNIFPVNETCHDLNTYLNEIRLQLTGKIMQESTEKNICQMLRHDLHWIIKNCT